MTTQLNREASGDQELVVRYSDMGGRLGRVFMLVLFGMLTAAPLWLILLCLNQLRILAGLGSSFDELQLVADPSTRWQVVWCGVVLLPVTLMFGWLSVRIAGIGRRSARGDWWLRLSSRGFEVNDRLGKPRRYEWHEIDRFMLVAPSANIADAVVAPAKTFAEAFRDSGIQYPVFRVGFHCSPGHRPTLAHKLFRSMSDLCDRDGTKADGLVMGYWDRPFDEAVDLMNEWLTRYKALDQDLHRPPPLPPPSSTDSRSAATSSKPAPTPSA